MRSHFYTLAFAVLACCGLVTKASAQALTVSFDVVNPLCNGSFNGSATAVVSGGAGPFVYAWSNGASAAVNPNLGAGTYSLTVTSTGGATASNSVTLTEPDPIAAYATCTMVCPGACNGVAAVTVVGGTPPYSFEWNNGATTQNRSNLCEGLYWLTISDSEGCVKIIAAEVHAFAAVAVNGVVTNPDCGTPCTGSIELNVDGGGTQTHTYHWNNGATNKNRYNLCDGTYSVTATSGEGCTGTASFTLSSPDATACTVTGDNSIPAGSSSQFCATDGAAYFWSNGSTTQCIDVSTAGLYSVTVTFANGCSSVCSRTLNVETNNDCMITGDSVICSGDCVMICAPNAASYVWSNGETTPCILAMAGTHTVTVTYANGTTASCSKTVTNGLLSCNISGPQTIEAGETAELCASGGTSFIWSNGSTAPCIDVTTAGTYHVTVTNASGCSGVCTKTVLAGAGNPGGLSCAITSSVSPANIYVGYGPQSATLGVNVTGGNGNYTYAWSGSGLSCTACANPVFTPTGDGEHMVSVSVTNPGVGTTACSLLFCVQDIVDPNNANKVLLCHVPPGNPANAHTISISVNAVPAHLSNHAGDHLGPCGNGCEPERNDAPHGVGHDHIDVYPNPFSNISTLEFTLHHDDDVTLELFTVTGVKVMTLFEGPVLSDQTYTVDLDGSALATGVYIYRLVTSTDAYTGDIIRMK